MGVASITITINDPSLDTKSAEAAYFLHAVDVFKTEFGRGKGTVTSGNLLGIHPDGKGGGRSLGSWNYTAGASKP
jgi:hypothetical protein